MEPVKSRGRGWSNLWSLPVRDRWASFARKNSSFFKTKSPLRWSRAKADSPPKTRGKPCGHDQCCADTGDASGPSQAVEKLPENRSAHEAAKERAGKIGPARDAAFSSCPSDKAGCNALREERSTPDQNHPGAHCGKIRGRQQRPADWRDCKHAPTELLSSTQSTIGATPRVEAHARENRRPNS